MQFDLYGFLDCLRFRAGLAWIFRGESASGMGPGAENEAFDSR